MNYNLQIESEQRYNRLLEHLTDYIYTVKVYDGKVLETYHGPGCISVTGYNSEAYLIDPELWYRMVHEEDKPRVLQLSKDALAGIKVEPLEHRIIHRDGSTRWVKNTIVLSFNAEGYLTSYDGLIKDITELKLAEELNALKQKELIQADKMVALGTMVSGIAHEINNPNNFIILNIVFIQKVLADIEPILDEYFRDQGDLLVGGIPYEKAKEKIARSLKGTLEGAQRIQKITRSLTDFARKDPGELNNDVDIISVAEISITITENLIKKSTDNFRVIYGEDLPIIRGNKQQLEQVVINLITNACQSLSDKKKKITISIFAHPEKNKLVIQITDEGIGIDEENLKYIFDPFFTTKRNSGGTGLGLYISYNIIKSHGGELSIKSEKGKGTTCEIVLPLKK
jgi:PAS domain S-box-containing protein